MARRPGDAAAGKATRRRVAASRCAGTPSADDLRPAWDGLCAAGLHGLDNPRQACDLCAGEALSKAVRALAPTTPRGVRTAIDDLLDGVKRLRSRSIGGAVRGGVELPDDVMMALGDAVVALTCASRFAAAQLTDNATTTDGEG